MNHNRTGFTLIETLIYLALLMLIMSSAVVSAFYIIDSSEKEKTNLNTIAEAGFLLRKIDWALTGADAVDVSVPGVMSVTKNSFPANPVVIDSVSGRARIATGGTMPVALTGDRVSITGLTFQNTPAMPLQPQGIMANFTADGKNFELTKYLRK